jgi:hypothetical protein
VVVTVAASLSDSTEAVLTTSLLAVTGAAPLSSTTELTESTTEKSAVFLAFLTSVVLLALLY